MSVTGLMAMLATSCVTVSSLAVTKLSTRTSTLPGSGMDSSGGFLFWQSGGSFSLQLCQAGPPHRHKQCSGRSIAQSVIVVVGVGAVSNCPGRELL